MKNINWSLYFINGLIAIFFGLLALFVPQKTIVTLVLYFGILLLIGGFILLYISIRNRNKEKPYGLLMFEALLVVLIGAIITFLPGESLKLFMILIGVWASLMGLLQIIMAIKMKGVVANHGMFTLNGVITLVFGLLLFFNPMAMASFFMVIIGILALVAGAMLVYLGIKVKGA